jgi:hypothetical protein
MVEFLLQDANIPEWFLLILCLFAGIGAGQVIGWIRREQ